LELAIVCAAKKHRERTTRALGAARDQAIYDVVRAIPLGKVATYGQIATLAGIPRGHRLAARAMLSCPSGLPWQRVLGRKDARRGQINIQEREHASLQRELLIDEGVQFDESGFISLRDYGWLPTDTAPTPRGR
jgi:methylated-DNA-protein-cysteine methyltransferase related protein